MNALTPEPLLDAARIRAQVEARDREDLNPFSKDAQIIAIRGARAYLGDRLLRTARPHRILDPASGPLIAVRLNILTRKTLGGLHTDLSARALDVGGNAIPGLFAVGEAAGFGGGGYHGYNALEGTFLGGCIFSGRIAGRACKGAGPLWQPGAGPKAAEAASIARSGGVERFAAAGSVQRTDPPDRRVEPWIVVEHRWNRRRNAGTRAL